MTLELSNVSITLGGRQLVKGLDLVLSPGEVVGLDYALEYGTDRLEIQADAFENSPRVLVVDDLLATGGTAAATGKLVEKAGGCLVGFAFVIELEGLGGRQALPAGQPVEALLRYG